MHLYKKKIIKKDILVSIILKELSFIKYYYRIDSILFIDYTKKTKKKDYVIF